MAKRNETVLLSGAGTRRAVVAGVAGVLGSSAIILATGTPERSARTMEAFQDPNAWAGWRSWGGSATVDEGVSRSGSRSLRLSASTGDQRAGAIYRFDEPQDFSETFVSATVRWRSPGSGERSLLGLRLRDRDGRDALYGQFLPRPFRSESEWLEVPVTFRPTVSDSGVDRSRITSASVYHYSGGEYPVRFWLDDIHLVPSNRDRGAVLIHFDDSHPSVYERAYPAMAARDMGGTFSVIGRRVGTGGAVSQASLDELHGSGWDICAHPQYDEPIPAMDDRRARAAFEGEVEYLEAHGFESDVMAWPYNQWNAESLATASEYFDLAFDGGTGPFASAPSGDAALVYPRIDASAVARQKAAVDAAVASNGVVCLLYHEIGEGTAHEEFEEILAYVDRSPVDVLTATDLLEHS